MKGSIQKRANSWRIRYDGPPDSSGRRNQVSETVKGAKRDAQRVLRERLGAIENGSFVTKTRETVGEFMGRWLDAYVATNTTPRTQQGYRGYVTRYILPAIGGIQLQALTAAHIQGMYGDMLARGLSPTTVIQLHRILRESLSHAVKWGLVLRNVADAATPPRRQPAVIKMWDVEIIQRFLALAGQSPYRDLYHLALLTGMRRSELAGLGWDNVDLKGCRLSVTRTLQRLVGKGLVEGEPKTGKSRRSIALSQETVRLLHSIHARQLEQRLAAGDVWHDTGYVFTRPDGRPIIPDEVSKDFGRIVRKHGLPHLTLHGLRHAHATLLLTAGVHPKVVSERLGHSNIAVTMDTYSHVLPGLQEQAVRALDEQLATRVSA